MVPEAVETLHCPTCLCRLVDGGETRCPACRAPISKSARPLPLIERELQARIEAKTAAHFRQRRRAAKTARRIASLPPTSFQTDAAPERPQAAPPAAAPASSIIVDIPATSVHEVRSTNDVTAPTAPVAPVVQVVPVAPVMPVVPVEPAKSIDAVVAAVPVESVESVESRPPRGWGRHRNLEPASVAPPVPLVVAPELAPDPVPDPMLEWLVEAVADSAPVAPKQPRRIRAVERLVDRVTERPAEPAVEPPVKRTFVRISEPVVERPVTRGAARVAEPAERPAQPAPIARIGTTLGTNSVWRDRVFNSAQRPAERAQWPRPRPSAPVAPVIDLPAEPVIDRIGEAAG